MASTEVEQQSQPLQSNKRWVLRVSIHCEGCKRKVKKLLQSLPGVDDIEIETKLQRVVVTGDVSPETLIRKLVKAGKHAQLWPENPPQIPNQKPPTTTHPQESPLSNNEPNPPVAKPENPAPHPSKTPVSGGDVTADGSGKVDDGVGKSKVTGEDGKAAVEIKVEEKKPETGSASNRPSEPVAEKKEEQTAPSGSGEGKKKKKKKPQNTYKNINGNDGGGPPATAIPTNEILPRHHGYYEYPPPPQYYTPPPPPVYTVSYNTSHPPVNSYTASYYAAPQPQSYAYSHYRSEMEPQPQPHHQPSDFGSYSQPPPQPLDSFEMFSDENPNGCLVM